MQATHGAPPGAGGAIPLPGGCNHEGKSRQCNVETFGPLHYFMLRHIIETFVRNATGAIKNESLDNVT